MRGWRVTPMVAILLVTGCGPGRPDAQTRRYTVTAANMEPGLTAGQRVAARPVPRGRYRGGRGDVVVFTGPDSWGSAAGRTFISRVVGVGGDVIGCCDAAGRVTVGGVPLREPYVGEDAPLDGPADSCDGRRFGPVTVPADEVFVLGDNRTRSGDSRCAGTVPAAAVIAVVVPARTW